MNAPAFRAGILGAVLAFLILPGMTVSAVEEPRIGVETVSTPEALIIKIQSNEVAQDIQIVVAHEDPLVGPVVDRVAEATVAPNSGTTVEVRDLRPDVPHNITILPLNVTIPPISDLIDYPNGSALADLPSLAEHVSVPLVPYSQPGTHSFLSYPVTTDLARTPSSRIAITAEGIVAVAWNANDQMPNSEFYDNKLRMAFSYDGGRTFAKPITVTLNGPQPDEFAWAADKHGILHMVFSEWTRTSDGNSHPAGGKHVTLDPLLGKVRSTQSWPGTMQAGHSIMAAATTNGILIAATESSGDVPVWHVADNGTVTMRNRLVPPGNEIATRAALAANGQGHVVVLFYTWRDGTWTQYEARSTDAGRTFGAPETFEGPSGGFLTPSSAMSLDPMGTLHFAGFAVNPSVPYDPLGGYYARFPLEGARQYTQIIGADADRLVQQADTGHVIVFTKRDERIWLYVAGSRAGDPYDATYIVESTDNGESFHPAFKTEHVKGGNIAVHQMATFIDGRPLLVGSGGKNQDVPSVMPFFDARPDPEQILTYVSTPVEAKRQPSASSASPVIPSEESRGSRSTEQVPAATVVTTLLVLAAVLGAQRRRFP